MAAWHHPLDTRLATTQSEWSALPQLEHPPASQQLLMPPATSDISIVAAATDNNIVTAIECLTCADTTDCIFSDSIIVIAANDRQFNRAGTTVRSISMPSHRLVSASAANLSLQLMATNKLSLLLLCHLTATCSCPSSQCQYSTDHYGNATCQPSTVTPTDSTNTPLSYPSTTNSLSTSPAIDPATQSTTATLVCHAIAACTCANSATATDYWGWVCWLCCTAWENIIYWYCTYYTCTLNNT